MSEIVNILAQFLDIIQAIITDHVLPQAGVGGSLEVHETENLKELVKFTVIFALGIAALFGLGLAMAAQKFAVKVDPRIEDVKGVLAGAHCGACGYPGCEQYAEAVVNDPNVPPNLCTPGGARAVEAVARITGKVAEASEPIFSRIMCQGSWS
ncbi:MAG: RnfABCDGE type electron transport complex subunit B, partial [Gammaproteobacteria bacterium]|nr:RnfABCDGE type electron transport complex subunit B [Gammaproteobacteria bacterium]